MMRDIPIRSVWLLLSLLWVFFVGYALWSYSLTDPNLVLSSWPPYWQTQQWLWQTLFVDRAVLVTHFSIIIVGLTVTYLGLLHILSTRFAQQPMTKHHWVIIAIVVLPVFFAYNALSHDIFNYIFNARMVVRYSANPHVQTALEFASDEWVRFMHNTHTPAPYGYGWTAVSIVPYVLGMSFFSLTWLLFKFWAVLSYVGLVAVTHWFATRILRRPITWFQAAALFLNPLLVIEVLGNGHNDLWMIVPAVLAVGVAFRYGVQKLGMVVGLLIFSILVKFATVLLLPVFIGILYAENLWHKLRQRLVLRMSFAVAIPIVERVFGKKVRANVIGVTASIASLLLFVPLLTVRSQQFHPWYLIWSLVWLPFISVRLIRIFLISLSVSSLFRYIPWLLAGGFPAGTVLQQIIITWVGGLTIALIWIAASTIQLRSQTSGVNKL